MKKTFFVMTTVIFSTLFFSCNNNDAKKTETQQQSYEMVTESVTNADGITLDMIFDKNNGTGIFTFNGETIEMNQDTTASGIRYSNDKYEFAEWQGEITLKENGEVIFQSCR